jgi:protein SCO1/2
MRTPAPGADRARRRLCTAAVLLGASALGAAFGRRTEAEAVRADHGRVVPPVPIPDFAVRGADGAPLHLAQLLHGRVTALHLMFTGCSSVCPIQGAIFQRVQTLLPDQRERGIQLLSVSIDPQADTPRAMQAWLQRFDARAGWIAVVPQSADLGRLQGLFGQGRDAVDDHVTQVNIINRRGELVFRTEPLPSADAIAELLKQV